MAGDDTPHQPGMIVRRVRRVKCKRADSYVTTTVSDSLATGT
jgi:hypothetical protein